MPRRVDEMAKSMIEILEQEFLTQRKRRAELEKELGQDLESFLQKVSDSQRVENAGDADGCADLSRR